MYDDCDDWPLKNMSFGEKTKSVAAIQRLGDLRIFRIFESKNVSISKSRNAMQNIFSDSCLELNFTSYIQNSYNLKKLFG